MGEIIEINNPDEKLCICNGILRALPNWFGNEFAILNYTKQVQAMKFFAAFYHNIVIGFVAVKVHNPYTSEIFVMGILKEYHRQGIGKKFIEQCENYCKENKMEFLTVKTLDESGESNSYANTRAFYSSMGFKPLEVFPLYWDEANPCLFMAKYIF